MPPTTEPRCTRTCPLGYGRVVTHVYKTHQCNVLLHEASSTSWLEHYKHPQLRLMAATDHQTKKQPS